jgi:hypothetical protein
MIHVPFVELKTQNRAMWAELKETIENVVSASQFVLGARIHNFKQ